MVVYTIKIENSMFSNIASNRIGGTIYIKEPEGIVCMQFCSFIKCTTTEKGNSTVRLGNVCGGACLLDDKENTLKSLAFTECNAIAVGTSLYVCTPVNEATKASCISTNKCGAQVTTITSIISLDLTQSFVRNINLSNSISQHKDGCILFGCDHSKISAKFMEISLNESYDKAVAFGASIGKGGTAEFSYVFVEKAKTSTGIITLWVGPFSFDNFVFYLCTGKIINFVNGKVSVTFTKSSLGSLDTSDVEKCTECSTDSKTTHFNVVCKFYPHNKLSCANNRYFCSNRGILSYALIVILSIS